MYKFAKGKKERRIGFFNELNEDYGPGKLVEKYHETFTGKEGEFAELMNTLREVDGNVREIAVPLKNTIKAARSSFNRREYIAAVSYLGQYHDALESIMNEFYKLKSAVDFKHNEFLFSGVDEEALKYFKDKLPLKFKPKGQEKKASISDWWSNLTSSKGRALKAWEQRFPKFAKKFKSETEKLLARAESLQNSLSLSLKGLASLRASRKLEEYLDVVSSLTNKYKEFDNSFEKYYNGYVQNFIEQQKSFNPSSSEVGSPEIGVKKENVETKENEGTKPEDKEVPLVFFPKVPPVNKDIKLDDVKPKDKGINAPAPFPDDEDDGEPSWPSPRSVPPSSHKIDPESFREMLGDEDILPPSDGPKPRSPAPSKSVEQVPGSGERMVVHPSRRGPGERQTLVVPEFNPEQAPTTEGIPGMVNIQEPFLHAPSARRPHDTAPPSSGHKTNPVSANPLAVVNQPSQSPQPYKISPSAFLTPVNDVRQPLPRPANDFRRHTLPAAPLEENVPDSIPIPPVRNAITPAPPENTNALELPHIPKPPLVPKKSVQNFLNDLSKLSNESPFVLANEIIRFAETLDDKNVSQNLLKIAKSLLK